MTNTDATILSALKEYYRAAEAFIARSPCDPDVTKAQAAAFAELETARARLADLLLPWKAT